ncbi:MAG: hypothetical protein WCI93_02750 [bacterium]
MKKKEIVWQVTSRYALVTCINNGRGIVVEKEIAPSIVNFGNAVWVNETSMYFRKKLHEAKVLLAEPYICFEQDGKAIQQSPYVGLDLEKIFQKGNANQETFNKLINAISGVLSQTEPEVGIDARLSNFCLGPNEEIYYVDTFPPLVKYQGEFIVHFPNPTDPEIIYQEYKRKFDPMGILRRLRFSVLEQDAGFTEQNILAAISVVLGNSFSNKTEEFFQTFLDHMSIERAFEKISLDDPDGIRELALKFMPPKGKSREDFLREIFNLSSNFCPYKITKEERIDIILELLSVHIK